MTMQPSPMFLEARDAVLQGQYERVLEMLPVPSTPDWAQIFWTGEAIPRKAFRPPWHLYNDRLTDIYITLFRNIAETRLGLSVDDQNITEHLYNATRRWYIDEVNAAFDLGMVISDIRTPDSFLLWENFCTHLPSLATDALVWPPREVPGVVHTDYPDVFQMLFFEAALTLLTIKKHDVAKALTRNMSRDQREIVDVLIRLSVDDRSLTEKHEKIIKKWETHKGVQSLLSDYRNQKPFLYVSVLEGTIKLDGVSKEIKKYANYTSAIFIAFLASDKEMPFSTKDIVESALPGKSKDTIKGIALQARQTFYPEFIKHVASHGYQLDQKYEIATDLQELERRAQSHPDQTLQTIDRFLGIEVLGSPFVIRYVVNALNQIEQLNEQVADKNRTTLIHNLYKRHPELLNARKNKN